MSGKFPRSPIMHSLPKMRNPPWLLPPLSPGATNKIPSPSEIAASIAAAGQRDMASARQDKRPLAVTGKPLRGPRPPRPNPPWWAPGGSGIDPNKTAPASNAPVIGNAPNGRPVTGAYSRQPGNQTTAAPDMAAYSPGRAQPRPPSQGTPYGIPSADGGNPYFMRPTPPANTHFTTGWNAAMAPYANTPGMSFTPATTYGGEGAGNMAYADPQSRPSPFDTWVRGFGGEQMQPNQFYAQRDALIQRLNSESGQRASQAGVYYDNEVPDFYQPRRDMNSLWAQAGGDISGGWNNPFTGMNYTPPAPAASAVARPASEPPRRPRTPPNRYGAGSGPVEAGPRRR